MKLVNYVIILSVIIHTDCQKFQQEQYPFPPQFQTPTSPILSSDSTIYLPPESSTSMPYFNMNNLKKLPVNYLPPTALKAPHVYPTPYSAIFSSSQRPDFDDEEIDTHNDIRRVTIPLKPTTNNVNITDKAINAHNTGTKDSKTITINSNYQQKMENNEKLQTMKQSHISAGKPLPSPPLPYFYGTNQNPAPQRRMIITNEIQRNDNDQIKSASFPSSQYLQAPGIFISSTVEPAIPILRLSNEMDLDGSFSYEALGADQTHYVQHSRMENMGTDKEEQVVEGSYSYIGDNGQTYTVHYVADSNGYRASGDHLPVPPPIPEIIQRAVQYNLAEEAKRPPHLRQNWESEVTDYDADNSDHRYTIAPLRNLFTGRTPEAFSLGLSQNTQGSIIPIASSPSLLRPIYDTIKDQNKSMTSIASIAPQITFLASQGAHNPSIPPQQTVSRIISTEKPILPQIMNYEANNVKDAEQDANRALWRWQYGINANDNNQNSNKNSISRSFGEGDDIIINFSNMTPEQYTKMMQAQVSDQIMAESNNFAENTKKFVNQDKYNEYNKDREDTKQFNNLVKNDHFIISHEYENPKENITLSYSTATNKESFLFQTTENPNTNKNSQTEEKNMYQNMNDNNNNKINMQSKIISSQNFAPDPQTITQIYEFEKDTSYEPNKINAINIDNILLKNKVVTENYQKETNNYWFENDNNNLNTTTNPILSTFNTLYDSDILQTGDEKSGFKPITDAMFNHHDYYTTTVNAFTESMKEAIQDNFFLKNLFKRKNNQNTIKNKVENEESKKNNKVLEQTFVEAKPHKVSKPLQQKIQNEVIFSKKKPLDLSDVLNFVVMKNNFESSKMKPKGRPPTIEFTQEYSQKEPSRYIPTLEITTEEDTSRNNQSKDNGRLKDKDRPHKLEHSVVKNYKTLQRHKQTGLNIDHQFVQESYRNVKTFPIQNLPPLGRAGPSLKTYLPPTYV